MPSVVAAATAFCLLLVGCSSDGDTAEDTPATVRSVAEELVAGPIADGAGLGELRPTCDDVVDAAVGASFECTAVTEGQRTVWLDAIIDQEGRVDLRTRNVITAAALPGFERAAVVALNQTVGTALTDEAVDCGDSSVVVGSDQALLCLVTDPNTGEVFDLTMTVTDIEARQFSVTVAQEPR